MSEIKVFDSISEFITYRDSLGAASVGFVPTMGALHAGHAQLIKRSTAENDVSVLSIFVNPTQFNSQEDLKKYPRTLEGDLKVAATAGATAVLLPAFDEIYPDNYRYKIVENDFSKKLCGAHREGHFDGVLTVVMKLLQIVRPGKSYFGEKDFQQLQLITDMARAFFLRTEIVACPTVREADGLAMSSRNVRLTSKGRELAPVIYKTLQNSKTPDGARAALVEAGIEPEYLEEHYGRRFVAAFIDGVRLIDNVKL
jgi:pantoate--beta-alanine ligase